MRAAEAREAVDQAHETFRGVCVVRRMDRRLLVPAKRKGKKALFSKYRSVHNET
jgi:hypothetical protein